MGRGRDGMFRANTQNLRNLLKKSTDCPQKSSIRAASSLHQQVQTGQRSPAKHLHKLDACLKHLSALPGARHSAPSPLNVSLC